MLQASLSIFLLWFFNAALDAVPVTLTGSAESMQRQHHVALASGFEFLRTPAEVRRALEQGHLVRLEETEALELKHPDESIARPEVKHFLERFAERQHAACGRPLVVTSLTRPLSRQPRNAHRLSVHPAGMAIDLRVPRTARCRKHLEQSLLELEADGVLDVTRERSPAHYHVALFPARYLAHVGLDRVRQPEVVAASKPLDAAVTPVLRSAVSR